jgi:hypothetical protein
MLFVGYFSCLIIAFGAVAFWLIGFVNTSMSVKHYHPRPPIVETVAAEAQVANEASPTKDDVSPVKHHKRKVLARQPNGNTWGYAEAYRNDPRGFFIH